MKNKGEALIDQLIGFELDAEYFKIAKERIESHMPKNRHKAKDTQTMKEDHS